MKRAILIFPFVLLSILSFSQKTKSIELGGTLKVSITKLVSYNDNNVPIDTSYLMMGKDERYNAIVSIITLCRGSKRQIERLLNKCMEMFSEDSGTSLRFGDSRIRVDKIMGIKGITLYGIGDDSDGYVYLNKVQVQKLIRKLNE